MNNSSVMSINKCRSFDIIKKRQYFSKACFPGTYGPNCEQNCSAVCTGSVCHYVDGSCPCMDGQNGYHYCIESKLNPLYGLIILLYHIYLINLMMRRRNEYIWSGYM